MPDIIDGGPFTGLKARHYRAILIDWPWLFRTRSDKGDGRSARRHYDCMTQTDMLDLAQDIRELAHRDAVMFSWTTDTHLADAIELMTACGFRYKTVGFYWAKLNRDDSKFTGMGFWTRANPEQVLCSIDAEDAQCLLGTRGSPKRDRKDVPKLIEAPRREHSRKPDEIYQRIERLVPGPYLDLFAREHRPNWTAWGHEKSKFDTPADLRRKRLESII